MRPRAWMTSCALLFALWTTPAAAQLSTEPPPSPPPQEDATGPLPLAEIPERADADDRFVQDTLVLARQAGPLQRMRPRLDALAASVREKSGAYRGRELTRLPVQRLESLDRQWRFDARRASQWREEFRAAGTPYTDAATELLQRQQRWAATLAATGSQPLPDALLARIRSVQAQLTTAQKALSDPLALQIALGRRANEVEAEIARNQKAVTAAIAYIDSRLAFFDAPPLWAASRGKASDSTAALLGRSLTAETRFVEEYSQAEAGLRRTLLALELLLLPLLVWLTLRERRRSGTQPAATRSPAQVAAHRALMRPISSWLLLAMIGRLLLEPEAPLLLQQMAMIAVMVPVLRLLPPHAWRVLGPWPYVASALYLLNRVGFLLLADDYVYRLYFLGLAGLTLVLSSWLLWRSRHLDPEATRPLEVRLVRGLAWLGGGVLAVSLVANVAGNVSLAQMLCAGLIDSGYVALVFYAAVNVLTALIGVLVSSSSLARLRITREHAAPLLHGLSRLMMAAAFVGWLAFTMNVFRAYRPAFNLLRGALTHRFALGAISLSAGNLLVFALSVVAAFYVARVVRFILREEVLVHVSLPRGVAHSVASLSYYALLLLGFLVALAAAGFKVGQLTVVLGAIGVGVGLGLQGVVNNFVSGLILMFERPIQPGDVVDVSGTIGRVRNIGMRATTIKTLDGADVVVPNGTLLSEKLTNWTLLDQNRRVELDVGVAYGSDPVQVMSVLREAVGRTAGLVDDPAPTVLFIGMGASSLDFSVRAWTRDYDQWVTIRSELVTRVHAALVEAGIEIPFPQQDLHVRSLAPDVVAALQARARRSDDEARPGREGESGA